MEQVGAYEINAVVGRGGMATVYKAYHRRLNRYVAIKMIHQGMHNDPAFRGRFEREAQIVAQLEHPHIVPVYDFSEHEGNPYLVMKYIEGRSLKDILSAGALAIGDMVKIIKPIAAAIDYAHSQGVLHRDIKPSNILLDKTGVPYLSDFGLARLAQANESTLSADMVIGTPFYISPEQALGKGEVTASADLYSFGVVLYELITGKVPYSDGTPYSIIHDHIYRELPLPSAINPNVPKAAEAVLLRALAKDPTDRYPTAAVLVGELETALAGENSL
ncbi:MAG: serine/threonine protein kinase, partial [Anaerolineae bacterium]|nr:serine/threonine protein kinase [Anaerolineae bacterium]